MRKAGIELLRIVTMLMIVCLHYLSKGGALTAPTEHWNANAYIAWLVEAFCLVAVNVYVLISGYFASASSATLQKTVRLWMQVWFYSVGIGVLSLLWGEHYSIYEVFQLLFPTVTEHYWFVTSFLVLSLFAPFLQAGAEKTDKKSFQGILLGFLLFTSIAKTCLPMHLPWDKLGYDAIWFVTLYLTGMYLRRYGIPKRLQNKKHALCMYVISELLIFISMLLLRQIYMQTGKLADFITYAYSYNHFLCYAGAIGLFLCFLQGKEPKERSRRLINTFAKATFGVYLIHEHQSLRYAWQKWFMCEAATEKAPILFILHMIITVAVVYLASTMIELTRQKVCSIVHVTQK